MRYRCPQCKESTGFYQNVTISGWQPIDGELNRCGDPEADWAFIDEWLGLGCSCGWEGEEAQLEKLGIDGAPLLAVHRDQTQMDIAA